MEALSTEVSMLIISCSPSIFDTCNLSSCRKIFFGCWASCNRTLDELLLVCTGDTWESWSRKSCAMDQTWGKAWDLSASSSYWTCSIAWYSCSCAWYSCTCAWILAHALEFLCKCYSVFCNFTFKTTQLLIKIHRCIFMQHSSACLEQDSHAL